MYFSTSTNCGHYFYVSYWRRDRHFTWSSEPREGLAICRAKAVPSFLSHFKTLCIVPVPGIEPATSRSAVKRSTDWDHPAAVTIIREDHTTHPLLTPSFDPQLFVTNVEVKTPFFYLVTRSSTLNCLKATILPAVRITQKADLADYKLTITSFVFGAS